VAYIFHITTAAEWAAAITAGEYAADSLGAEGFIHCSNRHQVAPVANTRFRGRTDLVLLHVDPGRLRTEMRYENLEGGRELFPHVYGPIPLDAVVNVTTLQPGEGGVFDAHAPLAG
jgi:uncharacterized protein (DUF952 family)